MKNQHAAIPDTAAELIAFQREQRALIGPPPAGNILEAETLVENLTAVLEEHIELIREKWSQQRMRWDLDRGESVPEGPAPRPFDPREDPTASALALLIGYVQDSPDEDLDRGDSVPDEPTPGTFDPGKTEDLATEMP